MNLHRRKMIHRTAVSWVMTTWHWWLTTQCRSKLSPFMNTKTDKASSC